MVWPAVIAAGAALAGGMLSNSSAKSREEAADKRQYELSKELWKYQMSNSHQFQVEDLKKAGINPILSSQMGSNTTGGVGGHISSGGNFENVLSNAVQAYQANKDAQVKDSQIETNLTQQNLNDANAFQARQNALKTKQEVEYLEKYPDAQHVVYGGETTKAPQQIIKNLPRTAQEAVKNADKWVSDKYEQFEKWVKDKSPISNAYSAYKNYQKMREKREKFYAKQRRKYDDKYGSPW